MRLGLPGHGRRAPWAAKRPADAAPALLAVTQGRDDGRPRAHGRWAAAERAAAARRARASVAAPVALRAALGPEPLRRAEVGRPRQHRDSRPGARRRAHEAGRGLAPLHRRGAGAHARRRLQAAHRASERHVAPAARPRDGAEALAAADLCARAGARSLRAAVAVLHAMGRRRRAAQCRPRPAGHAGRRLRPAGAAAGGGGRAALVGGAVPVGHAERAVDLERVRAPAAPAARMVRAPPHRRRDVALRRDPADPADADHALHRSRARRAAGGGDAGDDVRLQRHADGDRARRRGALRAAALGVLPPAAQRDRRDDRARGAPRDALPRIAARRCRRSSSSTASRTARRAS